MSDWHPGPYWINDRRLDNPRMPGEKSAEWPRHTLNIMCAPSGPGSSYCVASMNTYPDHKADADARLLAAAPQLYDALMTALPALQAAIAFVDDEAENRSAAGGAMSDYENEPKEISDGLMAILESIRGVTTLAREGTKPSESAL